MSSYSIVRADDAEDAYAGSDVPGEFRSLTQALEPVEIWAMSRKTEGGDSTKVEDFWEASSSARRDAPPS